MKRLVALITAVILLLNIVSCQQDTEKVPSSSIIESESIPVKEDVKLKKLEFDIDKGDFVDGIVVSSTNFYMSCVIKDTPNLAVGNLKTGEIKYYTPLSKEGEYIYSLFVLKNGECVLGVGRENGFYVAFLDDKYQIKSTIEIDEWDESMYPYYDRIRETLWYQSLGTGTAYGLNLNSGEREIVEDINNSILAVTDGVMVFCIYDVFTTYNTDTGEIKEINWIGPNFAATDFGGHFYNYNKFSSNNGQVGYVVDFKNPDHVYRIDNIENIVHIGVTGNLITSINKKDKTEFKVISTKEQLCYGTAEISAINDSFANIYWCSDNGSEALLYGNIGETPVAYLWRYGENTETAYATTKLTESDVNKDINKISKEIYSYTGIHVYGDGKQEIPYNTEYSFDKSYTPINAHAAMINIKNILDRFPKEIFINLSVKGVEEMEIHLTKYITPSSEFAIDSASAVAYGSEDNKRVIVLTVTNPWDLPHELSHVIEDRIYDYISNQQEFVDYMHYWQSFNPEKFDYFWDYHYEYNSETEKWVWNGEDTSDAYFIDSYSKTFPTEDRARIFENMFYGNSYYFEGSEPMKNKASYLASLIKSVFGYTGNLCWEQGLEVKPIEEYKEQVLEYYNTEFN